MAKLVIIIILNSTKVCNTLISCLRLLGVRRGGTGERRINRRTNRCLGRGYKGLCLRTKDNFVMFGVLLLVCSYLNLLINSCIVLCKSSYINRAMVIVRSNSGLQVLD